MTGVKRKILSVSDKFKIIEELENGRSNSVVCKTHNLSTSTVSTIWKNRDKLRIAFEKNQSQVKKIRRCEKNDLDEALITWFKVKRSENIPINGPILKIQADKLADQLGYKGFICSDGWLNRFKNRHQIVFGKIVGEEGSVNKSDVSNWLQEEWPLIKSGYQPDDIFNADETALFYKLTPDKTFKFKGEKCVGGKHSKVRLTVLLCSNMTGTEKRKLLVIGKSRNPRCFKNVKKLPVKYTANTKAWMTSRIFEDEIRNWDCEMRKKKRNILLLVDNCRAHPVLENLTNVKVVFLPPNTTAKLQPMDQGVIHSFKVNYRRLMILQLLDCLEERKEFNPSVLDAIRLIDRGWDNVSSTTIKNCFKKSGIATIATEEVYEVEDDVPLSEWIRSADPKNVLNGYNMNDYVHADDDVLITESPTDEEIINEVKNTQISEIETESENEDDTMFENSVVSVRAAQDSLELLTKFSETNNVSDEFIKRLNSLKNCFDDFKYKNQKQATLDLFFK